MQPATSNNQKLLSIAQPILQAQHVDKKSEASSKEIDSEKSTKYIPIKQCPGIYWESISKEENERLVKIQDTEFSLTSLGNEKNMGSEGAFPTIRFKLSRLYDFLVTRQSEQLIIEKPFLAGGGSGHVQDAQFEAIDTDIVIFITAPKFDKIILLLQDFILDQLSEEQIRFESDQRKIVTSEYLFEGRKAMKEGVYSFYALGDKLNVKFIYRSPLLDENPFMLGDLDSIMYSLLEDQNYSFCMRGGTPRDKNEYVKARSQFKCRIIEIDKIQFLSEVIFKLSHKSCQGIIYAQTEEVIKIASSSLCKEYLLSDPKSKIKFINRIHKHWKNHYPERAMGLACDLLNFLFHIQSISDNNQKYEYCQTLADIWLKTKPLRLKEFATFINKAPELTKRFLDIVHGMLFLKWAFEKDESVTGYPQFFQNQSGIHPHIGITEDKHKYHVLINKNPVEMIMAFLDSLWEIERTGLINILPILTKDFGFKASIFENRKVVIEALIQNNTMEQMPISKVLADQYNGKILLDRFYESLVKEFDQSKFVPEIRFRLLQSRLEHDLEEARQIKLNEAEKQIKALIEYLQQICKKPGHEQLVEIAYRFGLACDQWRDKPKRSEALLKEQVEILAQQVSLYAEKLDPARSSEEEKNLHKCIWAILSLHMQEKYIRIITQSFEALLKSSKNDHASLMYIVNTAEGLSKSKVFPLSITHRDQLLAIGASLMELLGKAKNQLDWKRSMIALITLQSLIGNETVDQKVLLAIHKNILDIIKYAFISGSNADIKQLVLMSLKTVSKLSPIAERTLSTYSLSDELEKSNLNKSEERSHILNEFLKRVIVFDVTIGERFIYDFRNQLVDPWKTQINLFLINQMCISNYAEVTSVYRKWEDLTGCKGEKIENLLSLQLEKISKGVTSGDKKTTTDYVLSLQLGTASRLIVGLIKADNKKNSEQVKTILLMLFTQLKSNGRKILDMPDAYIQSLKDVFFEMSYWLLNTPLDGNSLAMDVMNICKEIIPLKSSKDEKSSKEKGAIIPLDYLKLSDFQKLNVLCHYVRTKDFSSFKSSWEVMQPLSWLKPQDLEQLTHEMCSTDRSAFLWEVYDILQTEKNKSVRIYIQLLKSLSKFPCADFFPYICRDVSKGVFADVDLSIETHLDVAELLSQYVAGLCENEKNNDVLLKYSEFTRTLKVPAFCQSNERVNKIYDLHLKIYSISAEFDSIAIACDLMLKHSLPGTYAAILNILEMFLKSNLDTISKRHLDLIEKSIPKIMKEKKFNLSDTEVQKLCLVLITLSKHEDISFKETAWRVFFGFLQIYNHTPSKEFKELLNGLIALQIPPFRWIFPLLPHVDKILKKYAQDMTENEAESLLFYIKNMLETYIKTVQATTKNSSKIEGLSVFAELQILQPLFEDHLPKFGYHKCRVHLIKNFPVFNNSYRAPDSAELLCEEMNYKLLKLRKVSELDSVMSDLRMLRKCAEASKKKDIWIDVFKTLFLVHAALMSELLVEHKSKNFEIEFRYFLTDLLNHVPGNMGNVHPGSFVGLLCNLTMIYPLVVRRLKSNQDQKKDVHGCLEIERIFKSIAGWENKEQLLSLGGLIIGSLLMRSNKDIRNLTSMDTQKLAIQWAGQLFDVYVSNESNQNYIRNLLNEIIDHIKKQVDYSLREEAILHMKKVISSHVAWEDVPLTELLQDYLCVIS